MANKGYWMVHVTVTNPDLYPDYVAADNPVVAEYGGKFLVRGGKSTAPEGPMKDRHVVIEFKDYETALACYNSPGYQAALKIRHEASDSEIVIVEGHDG